jgi:VCBS repeat-containing protein
VTVVGVNDGPTATNDSFTVAHTGAVMLGNLLANDFDIDQGDTISVVPIEAASTRGAHFSIDAQGHAEYDPGDIFADLAPGETTTDSFSYTVVDSYGATSTATVNLTVNADGIVLDPRLRVVADSMFEGETTGNLFDLLAERAEGFGRIVSIGTPTQGAVTYDLAAHWLRFSADTPDLDYLAHGDTVAHPTFIYTVQDESGVLRMGEVRMYVQGIDDPADAADDAIALEAGTEIRLYDLLVANDDPDSRVIDIVSVDTTGMLGRIIPDSRNTIFSYAADTPELLALAPGETRVDHFTYTIRDRMTDNGPVTTATVTVTVTGVAHEASPMTSVLMAYGLEEAPLPTDALQAYAAPAIHVPDALMAYGAPEAQHAFVEMPYGFQEGPLHDPAGFFASNQNPFWMNDMHLA